jgi:hypothetical protein
MSGLGFGAGAHVQAPAVRMRILWVRVHSAACAESAWCKLSQVDPSLQCLPAWLQAEASGGVSMLSCCTGFSGSAELQESGWLLSCFALICVT